MNQCCHSQVISINTGKEINILNYLQKLPRSNSSVGDIFLSRPTYVIRIRKFTDHL